MLYLEWNHRNGVGQSCHWGKHKTAFPIVITISYYRGNPWLCAALWFYKNTKEELLGRSAILQLFNASYTVFSSFGEPGAYMIFCQLLLTAFQIEKIQMLTNLCDEFGKCLKNMKTDLINIPKLTIFSCLRLTANFQKHMLWSKRSIMVP